MTTFADMVTRRNNLKSEIIALYLDFTNNFLTITGFCDYYNFEESFAVGVLNQGRIWHEENVMHHKLNDGQFIEIKEY